MHLKTWLCVRTRSLRKFIDGFLPRYDVMSDKYATYLV